MVTNNFHILTELLKFIELHPHQRAEILKATPVYALLLEEGCLLLSVKSLRQPEQQQQQQQQQNATTTTATTAAAGMTSDSHFTTFSTEAGGMPSRFYA